MRSDDSAGVIAPPPLIFGGCFLVGLLIDYLLGTSFSGPAGWLRWIGSFTLAIIGGSLGLGAIMQFSKVGTNVLPDRPTRAVATDGPYRITRNPIYLGVALIYAAGALALEKPATLLLLAPALAVVHRGVILREERYLERKFGKPYLDYKAKVRRWL